MRSMMLLLGILWSIHVLCTKYIVSGDMDQQCFDNCSCCIDEQCAERYFLNTCVIGCIDGHRGERCYELCQYENCKSCEGSTAVCEECYGGYYLGPNKDCTSQCPSNCKSCTSSTMCTECKTGYYGQKCDESCSQYCANSNCDRNTGECVYGCITGYSGDKCCLKSEHCIECTNNIECKKCESGYFKNSCNESCPEDCPGSCDISTGECSYCTYNRFGQFCEFDCSDNCKFKDNVHERECTRSDGECINGCNDGYFGIACNKTCSALCFGGVCTQFDGVCINGCDGHQEEPECLFSKEQKGDDDTTDKTSAILGSLLAVAVVVIIIQTVFILLKTRRKTALRETSRRPSDATYENQLTSSLPDFSQNNEISTVSTKKSVVYEVTNRAHDADHEYQKISMM